MAPLAAFWCTVALLIGAALLFVLPPLWRRPQPMPEGGGPDRWTLAVHREQLVELDAALDAGRLSPHDHAAQRGQVEQRLIDAVVGGPGRGMDQGLPGVPGGRPVQPGAGLSPRLDAWLLTLGVPVLAVVVYLAGGQPGLLRVAPGGPAVPSGNTGAAPHAMSGEQMAAQVQALAERLRQRPDDADGWHMLARSYVAFGRYSDAADAYDKAVALSPRDPQLLTDHADALAMLNGRSLEGRPTELVSAALALDPQHQKALALAGTAAYNRRDFGAAVAHWQALRRQLPAESDQARRLDNSLAQARAAMGPGGTPPESSQSPAGGPGLAGELRLSDALRGRVPPNGAVFVFARGVGASGAPLAVLRLPLGEWPMRFALDDRHAMSPQARLSAQREVQLGVRISATGSAAPRPGDLTGQLGPVALGRNDLVVSIDGVVP